MEGNSIPNNTEKITLKLSFKKDLLSLVDIYPPEVLKLVEDNENVLLKNYEAWQKVLVVFSEKLGIKDVDVNEIPNKLERVTFEQVQETLLEKKIKKIIFGIAGPGAVGKETIKNDLGFEMVVNTTTRLKRNYEKNNKHYHFVNIPQFKEIESQNGFVVSMERPGRGSYGISKKDIKNVLSTADVVMIEENPENLAKLDDYLKTNDLGKLILVYILPPSPILLHLAARLAGRCQKTGENFKSAITSTLGIRQLNEFNSILDSIRNGRNVVFVVNDNEKRATARIKTLI
ncbi:hypothetical protein KKG24_03885 [Patescibacteria group bacterium]|nr:hypothetical protein [Patescibacteria group bacterium]